MSQDQEQTRKSPPRSPLQRKQSRNNSFASPSINNSFMQSMTLQPINQIPSSQNFQPKLSKSPSVIQDNSSLQEQNKKLRRKLKQLSLRLDEQLQRAAQNKLKMQNLSKLQHPTKPQTQSLELQNAYKMIQRLQKTVHEFQNKQSYQISLGRIMDLESIIKKKQAEIEQQKQEIKTSKKILREKEKLINQLLENAKKDKNVTEDKDLIERLKKKMKKLIEDNDQLRKKQLSKHQQLVKAQRKIVQMEQQGQSPIGREESLVNELEDMKKKYKQAMQRIQRLNIYVTKLNQKLDKQGGSNSKARYSQGDRSKRQISKSLQQLPSLKNNKAKPIMDLLQKHLPSPKAPIKLKRY